MQKFRLKLPLVNAKQWFPDDPALSAELLVSVYDVGEGKIEASIQTGSGKEFINPGDWIVFYQEGYKKAIPDEIFKQMYESAN
jgi:hypothetical protein